MKDYELKISGDCQWGIVQGQDNKPKNVPFPRPLPPNPDEGAKRIVDQARKQYSKEGFKTFRYRFLKEAEDK